MVRARARIPVTWNQAEDRFVNVRDARANRMIG